MNLSKTFIILPLTSCLFVDLPSSGFECATKPNHYNKTECIRCNVIRRFFFHGETLNNYDSPGHSVTLAIGITTLIIGIFGTFANLVIILILQRQKIRKTFNTMLLGLAVFDLLCSSMSVISATGAVFYIRNWDRGRATLEVFSKSHYLALLGRSGSSFLTILIAFERYMVVTYPCKATTWFTQKRVQISIVSVTLLSLVLAIPRFSSTYVSINTLKNKNIPAVEHQEYIIFGTELGDFWYITMHGFFNQIDYWVPLPLLLILNALIYGKIRKIAKKRKELSTSRREELRAAEMLIPVLTVLLICYFLPIINYYFIFHGTVYWELTMGMLLSFSVNACANLPIYYFNGSFLKQETRAMVHRINFTNKRSSQIEMTM